MPPRHPASAVRTGRNLPNGEAASGDPEVPTRTRAIASRRRTAPSAPGRRRIQRRSAIATSQATPRRVRATRAGSARGRTSREATGPRQRRQNSPSSARCQRQIAPRIHVAARQAPRAAEAQGHDHQNPVRGATSRPAHRVRIGPGKTSEQAPPAVIDRGRGSRGAPPAAIDRGKVSRRPHRAGIDRGKESRRARPVAIGPGETSRKARGAGTASDLPPTTVLEAGRPEISRTRRRVSVLRSRVIAVPGTTSRQLRTIGPGRRSRPVRARSANPGLASRQVRGRAAIDHGRQSRPAVHHAVIDRGAANRRRETSARGAVNHAIPSASRSHREDRSRDEDPALRARSETTIPIAADGR
jgi:hypothetical protein